MPRIEGKHVQNDHEIVVTVDDFCFYPRITFDNGTEDAGDFVAVFIDIDYGAVANWGNNDVGRKYLKRLCADIHKRSEVDLVGIGIGRSGVKNYYPNHVELKSVSELPNEIFQRIKKFLG